MKGPFLALAVRTAVVIADRKTVEAFLGCASEQGVAHRRFGADELLVS